MLIWRSKAPREQLIGGVVNVKRSEYLQDIELADLLTSGAANRLKKDLRLS